jgi:hypothetical protein
MKNKTQAPTTALTPSADLAMLRVVLVQMSEAHEDKDEELFLQLLSAGHDWLDKLERQSNVTVSEHARPDASTDCGRSDCRDRTP